MKLKNILLFSLILIIFSIFSTACLIVSTKTQDTKTQDEIIDYMDKSGLIEDQMLLEVENVDYIDTKITIVRNAIDELHEINAPESC